MKYLKSLFIFFSICLFTSGASQAQDDTKLLGAKIGFNASNVYDSNQEDFEANYNFGLAAGGFLLIPLSENVGIQPEFMFSSKGFRSSGTFLGSSYELNRRTTHIDVPIQLALKPTENLTLLIGPNYSYTLSKKDEMTFNDNVSGMSEEEFENNNIRRNTLGVIGGFDVKASDLVFSSRVGWDMQKNNGDGSSSDIRYKNFWMQFTVGVMLF